MLFEIIIIRCCGECCCVVLFKRIYLHYINNDNLNPFNLNKKVNFIPLLNKLHPHSNFPQIFSITNNPIFVFIKPQK